MLRNIPVIQGSRKGYILNEYCPGWFSIKPPENDYSKSKERTRDVNDYVIGWIEVDGHEFQIAYTTRPERNEILAQLRTMHFIH
ncbi:hypothetical protein IAF05_02785 [Dickeya dianthicola]|uniref:hypothetical protein n=1 Tax=Dickeya dianthicola TaxID=204039 RepID=UPI001BDF0DB5|nr:hypothetical protein [Dickeya dianthicola]MBT1428728.1 hypothetical protein [Dickeya dianthicola]MBT1458183.1 hypothetical protein [Dickeya dianthicola]MBT1487320.1 hypothetical protein [Dickeya dianthicola]MBT1488164.1 hypothetical protein [Dickeya dianthicola]